MATHSRGPAPEVRADQVDRYRAALELAQHDNEMVWVMFGAFFVGHTVLLGFIGLALAAQPPPSRWELFAAAGLGMLLWVPWYASFKRNRTMHYFRVNQARSLEPPEWGLLAQGNVLAEGGRVTLTFADPNVPSLEPQMPWTARQLRNWQSVLWLQGTVFAGYLVLLVLSFTHRVGT